MSTDIEMQEIGVNITHTDNPKKQRSDCACLWTIYTIAFGIIFIIASSVLFAVYWKPTLDETHDLIKSECFINSRQLLEGPCNGIRCIDCKSNDYPPCDPIFNSSLPLNPEKIYCKLGPGNYWIIPGRPNNGGDILRSAMKSRVSVDDGKRDCYQERICYITPHNCYSLHFNVTYTLDYTTTSIVIMNFQREYTKLEEIQDSYTVNSSTQCYVNPENGQVHFYPDIYLLFKILILAGYGLAFAHLTAFGILIYMHVKTKCMYWCVGFK